MTDEFFCGVHHVGLRWRDVVRAVFTSITASFAPDTLKQRLLDELTTDLFAFIGDLGSGPSHVAEPSPFATRHLGV